MGIAIGAGIAHDNGYVRFGFRVFTGNEGSLYSHTTADAKRAPQSITDELDTGAMLAALRCHGEDRPFDEFQPRVRDEDAGLNRTVVLGAAPTVVGKSRFGHSVPAA